MATTPTRTSRSSLSSGTDSTPGRSASDPASSENTILNRSADFLDSTATSRQARIAEAAYYRAERRGFGPGNELEDWLEAEREVDAEASRAPTKSSTAH